MKSPKDILPPWYLARKLDPDKLPPWTGDAAAQKKMYAWVNLELDLILDTDSKEHSNKAASYWTTEKYAEALPRLREAAAIKYAEHGNIEPLRRLFPRHAKLSTSRRSDAVNVGPTSLTSQPAFQWRRMT